MNARTLIITATATVALAAPAIGSARTLPIQYDVKNAKSGKVLKVTAAGKTKVTNGSKVTRGNKITTGTKVTGLPRCVCIISPTGPAQWVHPTQAELEAAFDADLVAHGMEPYFSVIRALEAE